jgi:hypothetical protein
MSRSRRVRRMTNMTLYADIHRQMRVVQRLELDYTEVKASTLHALLRMQPGYDKAARGKNKHRIRWFLRAVPQLPGDLVVQYIPSGVIGAVLLLRSVLPPKCTGLPFVKIEQLCVLALELAPYVADLTQE